MKTCNFSNTNICELSASKILLCLNHNKDKHLPSDQLEEQFLPCHSVRLMFNNICTWINLSMTQTICVCNKQVSIHLYMSQATFKPSVQVLSKIKNCACYKQMQTICACNKQVSNHLSSMTQTICAYNKQGLNQLCMWDAKL